MRVNGPSQIHMNRRNQPLPSSGNNSECEKNNTLGRVANTLTVAAVVGITSILSPEIGVAIMGLLAMDPKKIL